MRLLAALVFLVITGTAWAAPQPAGMGNPAGIRVYQSGNYVADCQAFDLAASDWAVALVGGGVCTLDAGPTVLLDNGGQIGAAADFSTVVDLSQTQGTILPAGTADRTSACTAGSIYMETDDTTVTNNGSSLCIVTGSPGTWKWIGDITSGGQTGGQSITGGIAATDSLTLNPTSSSGPTTARVKMCGGTPSLTSNPSACVSIFPDGATETLANGEIMSGIEMSGTITQGNNQAPEISILRDSHTIDLIGSGVSFGSTNYTINAAVTFQNSNSNATVLPGPLRGMNFTGSCRKAGAGSNFSFGAGSPISAVGGGVGTIATGCTVDTYIAGVHAVGGGSVAGTLTNLYGVKVDAQTVGTNRLPYAAAEQTITGTNPANVGSWGVESGAPNRFYFLNDAGHIWRTGWATMTASTVALSTTATEYFPLQGSALAINATDTNVDSPVAGAMKVYAIACGLETAPTGATKTRTFTLRRATPSAADSTLTCTITDTAKSCAFRVEAGVAYAAGDMLVWKSTSANTPSASTATCTLWWNLDAF